jgi:hypothetical protein
MRLLSIIVFTVVLISNTFGQTTPTTQVKTIDDLVALRIPTINNRLSALVTGRVTENDGGGGVFFYDGSAATTTNLGTIFKPAASAGRWVRQYSGDLNLLWFGADPTGALSAHTSLTNAIGVISGGGKVFMPSGTYLIDKPVTVSNNNIWLYGAGQRETILDGNTSPVGAFPLLLVDNGTDGIEGFTIKDLTINMDRTTPSGIEFVGARPFLIDNILINGDIGLANQGILIGNRPSGYSAFSTIQNSYFTSVQYGIVITNDVSDFSIVNNSFINGVNPNNAAIVIGSTVTDQGVISGNELEGWTYALHQFDGGGVKFVNNRTETIATSVVRWESGSQYNWAIGNSQDGGAPPTTPYDDQSVAKNNIWWSPLDALTAFATASTFSSTTNIVSTVSPLLTYAGAMSVTTTAAGALTLAPFAGSGVTVTTSGAGNFAVNTSELVVDTGVGVGIGTASPGAKLDVKSSGAATWAMRALASDSGSLGGIYEGADTSSDFYLFQSDGSTVGARINSMGDSYFNTGGNVGIGTAGPGALLDVGGITGWGGSNTGLTASFSGVNSPLNGGGNLRVVGNTTHAIDTGASITIGGMYNGTANQIDFAEISGRKESGTINNVSGYLAFATRDNLLGQQEWMRITSAGAVGIGTPIPLEVLDVSGNIQLKTAGNGIKIKEGSNARMGTATLVGGTVVVANTSVTTATRVFISRSTTGGTEGTLSTTLINGTSFTVNSTSGTDTSSVNWLLIEPAP